jgi:hypothetical protein
MWPISACLALCRLWPKVPKRSCCSRFPKLTQCVIWWRPS